ncbi:PaaI family thioesterase [Wenxinia marina]|uniref:Thioesterase domain-containing protein n=1 Tax=Wenxinia marina DSM 24838 TaxID=1123501 RepID=A0A0D0PAC1_9RHOB|nr:PaaI family thioesterase [Wenxinia marina]KIQ68451.1 hypothetical protein Wenmar_03099 [Wenxinia marina DSM 24838]
MTRPIGTLAPEERAAMSGLDFMRAVVDGTAPQVPMHVHLGFTLVRADPGLAGFVGAATEECLNPMGGVHGGWYASLLDSAMGCALMTTLPQGTSFTTLEFKLNMMRAVRPGDPVTAEGRVIHGGRRTAVVAAEITAEGRTVAAATGTCLILS